LHPNHPVQRQLPFRNDGKKEKSKGVLEKASMTVLPLLALPDAHTPEFIGALAAPDESRAHPDTTRKTRS
jgi:hypothetical protein